MKKNIFVRLLILMIMITSCNDYLDIVPDNVATLDHAFRDRVRAEQYLFTCYSYMPRHGLPQSPGRFDDFVWSHSGVPTLPQYGYTILRDRNNVTSPILDYWNGLNNGSTVYNTPATNLWQGIRDCNTFIERVNEAKDLEPYEKKSWTAEAKFLKAYYHFFLLQMYGPIPIIRENIPINATEKEVMVYREPIDDVFNYIVELLDEAIPELPLKIENEVSEMGRITKAIALSIKAKVLVTAASPLFNGNDDYISFKNHEGKNFFNPEEDPQKWEKAREACKNAIDSCHLAGHRLFEFSNPSISMSEETRLILQVSQIVTNKWNTEHIWGTGHYSQSSLNEEYTLPALDVSHYTAVRGITVPTLKAVEYFYSKNGVPIEEDVTYDYLNRYKLTLTSENDKPYVQPNVITAKLHLNREPRFYGSVGFDNGWWFGLGRFTENQQWPVNVKGGEVSGPRGIERFSITGFYIKKLSDFNSVYSGTTLIRQKWDFPILRLADLYLLYAEALNETLTNPNQEVYEYIDLVRQRAGLKGVVESWSNYSTFNKKHESKEGMREIIQRERSIELAFEEQRFWDVRRWGRAMDEFDGPVQGWYYLGEDDNDFYRVTSINNVIYTRRDIFWPLRQYDLSVNTNLVQNPEW